MTNDEHFPWHYTSFGVICACGTAMRSDETCPTVISGVECRVSPYYEDDAVTLYHGESLAIDFEEPA